MHYTATLAFVMLQRDRRASVRQPAEQCHIMPDRQGHFQETRDMLKIKIQRHNIR